MNAPKRKILYVVILFLTIVAAVLVGPMDVFCHGFYCDPVSIDTISTEDFLGNISLSSDYETTFMPTDRHFCGFEIYLKNQPDGNYGILKMIVSNSEGEMIESVDIDLSEVTDSTWYMVYTSENYRKDEVYTLRFHAENCSVIPELVTVDNAYLPDESMDNNLLLSFAYSESTFTFTEKLLFGLMLLAIHIYLIGDVICESRRKFLHRAGLFIFLIGLFSWNYMYNTFDRNADINNAEWFSELQSNSETLVIQSVQGELGGAPRNSYGLGRWRTAVINNITNDETGPVIEFASNVFTNNALVVGAKVEFANGEVFTITELTESEGSYFARLDTDKPLNKYKLGDLSDVRLYGGYLEGKGGVFPYESQYGLQGKFFRSIVNMFGENYLEYLYVLCGIATATVLVTISFLIKRRFNLLMAVCYAITFGLSPWVAGFARNLYWVEFTWFLPMLFGLVCSIWRSNWKVRIGSYVAVFAGVAVKSLCGYEFITVVMLGSILFLLVDLVEEIASKNKREIIKTMRTIILVGMAALAGFALAICMHAVLRGDGSVVKGIKDIIEQDVIRRTTGGNMNDFPEVYWEGFNASIWETLVQYFHFDTEILPGIGANLFPILAILPLGVFGMEYRKKQINIQNWVLYIVTFVTCISWYVLGKSHAYNHRTMSYVLWYFGFIQICIYILADKLVRLWKRER